MPEPTPSYDHVSPYRAGLSCRCPRCGIGPLFTGPFSLVICTTCTNCGLDYTFIDSGDGPAVFAIMLLGFVMVGAALFLEFRFSPPLWVHVAIWTPITIIISLGLLRPLKGLLIALQFHRNAALGQLEKE